NKGETESNVLIRPALLSVLCILTFVGSSWTIGTNAWIYNTAEKMVHMIAMSEGNVRVDSLTAREVAMAKIGRIKRREFGERMMKNVTSMMTEERIRQNASGNIVSGVFTLIGALLMWRLKLIGFTVYILGVLISIVAPFFIYGANFMGAGVSVFTGLVGLAFIALYSLNIKSLLHRGKFDT
ncbi:MAG: hypothetical protein ABIR19_03020, partial [Ginsengibacter sp.]